MSIFMVQAGEPLLWGAHVRIKRSPHPEQEGLCGTLRPPHQEHSEVVALFVPDLQDTGGLKWGAVEVLRGSHWEFDTIAPERLELTQPSRREREVYDAASFTRDLDAVLGEIRTTLVAKNAAYGSSALDPVRIFSKASPREQILVRMDDKLSRLDRGANAGEDVLLDLLGYLLLLRIADRRDLENK